MSVDIRIASVCVILKELGVPLEVSAKEHRIAMQKAVYLAQTLGPDLGFRYGWYLNGHYSSELSDAYYQASKQKTAYADFKAGPETSTKLKPVKDLISRKPENLSLSEWLEAAGSIHFMIRVMRRTPELSLERCRDLKPHLSVWFQSALDALWASNLLPHAP